VAKSWQRSKRPPRAESYHLGEVGSAPLELLPLLRFHASQQRSLPPLRSSKLLNGMA
jgi:hypothetical protein